MEDIIETVAFEKHSAYKDSGVEWLGKVPEHWEVKRLKFLGYIYPGLNGKKGDDFTKEYVFGSKPFIPFTNIYNNSKIDDEQYQYVRVNGKEIQNRVQKNDILFLMSSETFDDIAKCSIYVGENKELYLNSFCKGFRIKSERVNPEYLNYLLLSSIYRNYFVKAARGFTRINLKQEFINDVFTIIPSVYEQNAIVDFLDNKTSSINQAIAQKEKQIELLKERRQVLINKAVTRGLNSDVSLKDSGVEWIGEIPEHWEVKRLKYILKAQGRIGFKGYTTSDLVGSDEGALTFGASHIDWDGNFDLPEPVYISWKKYYESPEIMVSQNDILIVQRGSTCGKVAMVSENYGPATINPSLVLLKNIKELPVYVFLGIKIVLNGILNLVSKTAIPMLSQFQINNILIPVPPRNEQSTIIDFVDKISSKLDKAISCKEKEIEKLKEYKATLINSAVTGKIKVT